MRSRQAQATATSSGVSRRQLLGGVGALAALIPLDLAQARRFAGVGLSPTVGPGAAWNGTAGSGGTAPTDPTRTTAKPAAQWLVPDMRVLAADMQIGLDADALGGVASVQFWVEGNTVTVTTAVLATPNGVTVEGYFITLSASAFAAHQSGSAATIYATVTPSDGTMQARVIGPLTVYPRATENDRTYTIGATTGTYATVQAANTQMLLDAPERPMFKFVDSGSYEVQCTQNTYTTTVGYTVYAAAAGVTATLIRGNSFDPLNTTTGGVKAWEWWPNVDQIEFRGSGVVLDLHNWNNIHASVARPYWFSGCQIINSANARDVYYWDGSPPPGFLPNLFNGTLIPCLAIGCTIKYVDFFTSGSVTPIGCSALGMLTGDHGELHYAQGNYETQTDPRVFTTLRNAISVYYTGTGTGSIVVTAGANTLDCKVNGTTVGAPFPITLGNSPAATYFTMANVVSAINAIAGGAWHATTLDNNLACWALAQASATYSPLGTSSGTATNLTAFIDYHTEWVHTQTTNCQNILYRGNTIRRSYFTTSILNAEHGVYDAVLKGNVWEQVAQQLQNGGWAGSHVVVENNLIDCPFAVYPDTNYSKFSQNVFAGVNFGSGSGLASMPASWTYNVVVTPWPAGADASNATVANYAALSALFTDKANGDFRPSGTMPTAARLDLYDGRLNVRAATDAFAPWALGYSAPSWPF